jgi:hypothetical protein
MLLNFAFLRTTLLSVIQNINPFQGSRRRFDRRKIKRRKEISLQSNRTKIARKAGTKGPSIQRFEPRKAGKDTLDALLRVVELDELVTEYVLAECAVHGRRTAPSLNRRRVAQISGMGTDKLQTGKVQDDHDGDAGGIGRRNLE